MNVVCQRLWWRISFGLSFLLIELNADGSKKWRSESHWRSTDSKHVWSSSTNSRQCSFYSRGNTGPLLHPILSYHFTCYGSCCCWPSNGTVIRYHALVTFSTETLFSWSMQALVVTTLGGDNMGQRVDNLTSTEDLKRFYLQVRYLFLDLVHVFLMSCYLFVWCKLDHNIAVGCRSTNNLVARKKLALVTEFRYLSFLVPF